jgi:hypothetical protein
MTAPGPSAGPPRSALDGAGAAGPAEPRRRLGLDGFLPGTRLVNDP